MYGYIYKTTNLVNGKCYIGKKKGDFVKWYYGSGRYLKNALNKYGKDNFKVEKIEDCETLEIQNEREKYWIQFYLDEGVSLYNISRGGDGGDTYYKLSEEDRKTRIDKLTKHSFFANLTPEQKSEMCRKAWETRRRSGTDKMSEEQRKKLSEARKGKKLKPETIQKMIASRRGYRHSEETRHKIAESNSGKTRSEAVKLKMSLMRKGKYTGKNNPFYGKHHTQETKDKIAEMSRLGICGNKGKHLTEEHKKHLSESNKGKLKNNRWMNDGIKVVSVKEEEVQDYLDKGYKFGRKVDGKVYTAWNKGLTAKTDERVANYIKTKIENFYKSKGVKNV